MPVISIILAAYNAESTVARMIDSIKNQTYQDWELIAINDGSKDSTGAILDKYAAADKRIRAIHKANGGVAAARQCGIDLAQGDFTIHADSDDWVEPDMLKELLNSALKEGADIVIADYFTDSNGKSTVTKQTPSSLASDEILYELYSKGLFGGLCNKLIKRSAYYKAQASFKPGINYCEDLLMLTQILTRTKPKVAYVPKPFYHYVLNDNSLTQAVNAKGLESMKRFHQEAIKLLCNNYRFQFVESSFAKNEFTVYFMNKLYQDKTHLQTEYHKLKATLIASSGLRWRLGYKCIDLGLIGLAHQLIKF